MDYFVSIDNTAYDRWQAELLIESFKQHNLQDYLCIAIAANDEPQHADYSKNLKEHKRKVMHDNFGDKNNIFSLIIALDNNFIREPFTLLRPHMILTEEIQEGSDNVIWNVEADMPDKEEVKSLLSVEELDPIINPGDVYIFKNCPNRFFHKIAQRMTELSERLAIILTLYEYYGYMTMGSGQLEIPMIYDNVAMPIINYRHGYPPHWHRMNYNFGSVLQFSTQPYNDLLKIDMATAPLEYVQKITRNYLNRDVK